MKQYFILFILILLLVLAAGCSDETQTLPEQDPMEFSVNSQTIHIIPLYVEVLDYARTSKENPEMNNKSEYFSRVVQPFQNQASENSINLGDHYSSYFWPTRKVEELEVNTEALLKNQEKINELLKEALTKSAKQLQGSDKTFFIMPVNPEYTFPVNHMEGVSGVTLSENAVLLQIDSSFLDEALTYAAAHEYHHTVYMENHPEKNYTLLDSFIFEGEAEAFARQIYPEKEAPWAEPLENEPLEAVLQKLKNNAGSTSGELYYEFVTGNPLEEIPLWSSYKLGHRIVDSYLENHPEVSIEDLIKTDSKKILEGSEFSGLLQKEES